MSCLKYRELIELDLDGQLSQREQKELARHLKSCLECQAFQDEVVGFWQDLDSITCHPPQDLVAPVMAQIKKQVLYKQLLLAGLSIFTLFGLIAISLPLVGIVLEFGWISSLLAATWRSLRVVLRAWYLVIEHLPSSYWLGLTAVAVSTTLLLLNTLGLNVREGKI